MRIGLILSLSRYLLVYDLLEFSLNIWHGMEVRSE
jgi:hypothetical protein